MAGVGEGSPAPAIQERVRSFAKHNDRSLTERIVLLAFILFATVAHAETRGASKLGVYKDNDNTLVVSPTVTVSATPIEGAVVGVGYVADMVTSGSVDVTSAASSIDLVSGASGEFRERRDAVTAHGAYTTREYLTLGLAYDWSHEADYLSHTPSVSISKELFDRNVVVVGAYALSMNEVGRSGDPNFAEDMTNHSVTLSVSQLLSPKSLVRFTYQGQRSNGWHASSYRWVTYGAARASTPEQLPGTRARHAGGVAWRGHLSGPYYLHADYRFYRDDWGLTSHTGGLQGFYEIDQHLAIRLRQRLHYQGGASFYEDGYDDLHRYMTSDKELSQLWTSTTGLKVDYEWRGAAGAMFSTLGVNAKVEYLRITYMDFERLSGLNALVAEIGTAVAF